MSVLFTRTYLCNFDHFQHFFLSIFTRPWGCGSAQPLQHLASLLRALQGALFQHHEQHACTAQHSTSIARAQHEHSTSTAEHDHEHRHEHQHEHSACARARARAEDSTSTDTSTCTAKNSTQHDTAQHTYSTQHLHSTVSTQHTADSEDSLSKDSNGNQGGVDGNESGEPCITSHAL